MVYDELVHASVHDGMRASRVPLAQRRAFAHNDPSALSDLLESLEETIRSRPSSTVFLALESLYSMDGDFAPLPALLDVFDRHVPGQRQCVVVDEAHTTGVYGRGGRGVVHALGEHTRGVQTGGKQVTLGRVTVRLMTFGKGAGASGAVLLTSPPIRSFLINFARPFIFSTAPSLTTIEAIHAVWDYLDSPSGDTVSFLHFAKFGA